MNIKLFCFIIGVCVWMRGNIVLGQQLDYKHLGLTIQQVIKKVTPACVGVTFYDSISKRAWEPGFSAVVVSADGYILTCAHAVSPNNVYLVTFPDGRQVMALGLGSIQDVDAAILKIIPEGNWPYAEMGWSSGLPTYQPCISMGYPVSLRMDGVPFARFGYITNATLFPRFLGNTSLMEPGDSGGPLFDLNGRVIGIHSRIGQLLDENYEVPVDIFRKYWKDLTKPQLIHDATSLIAQEVAPAPAEYLGKPIPALAHFHTQFPALMATIQHSAINLNSVLNGKKSPALGTLVAIDKRNFKNKSYIISKSSIVGDDSITVLYETRFIPAKVVARDSLQDLVLLEVGFTLKGGVEILANPLVPSVYNAGKFLLSPGTQDEAVKVSVLSSSTISYLPKYWGSYLGIQGVERKGAVRVGSIDRQSIASLSDLKVGDKIVSINGIKVRSNDDLYWAISEFPPKSKILYKGKRKGFGYKRNIVIKAGEIGKFHGEYEGVKINDDHMANYFEGGPSLRNSGFRSVFIHDSRLLAWECGGPVFDAEGCFMGINIARVSRVSSIGIPAKLVRSFVQEALRI